MDEQRQKPENNLVWAIVSTLVCCWPLGVVAIVKAAQVDGLYYNGKYDEAVKTAEEAKKFAMWSAIVAGIFWFLYICIIVFLASLGFLNDL